MIKQSDIQACLSGSRRAHKTIYESTIALSYSIARRYLSSDADQADAIQEAYAKVFSKMHMYDCERGSFNGWLGQIVVNECLMHLRRTKKLSKLVPLDQPVDRPDDAEEPMEHLTRADVDRLLDVMPSGYRVVFMLYVIDGYSHNEIGQQIGISPDTSRSQLSRAKRWMRKHLVSHPIITEYGQY